MDCDHPDFKARVDVGRLTDCFGVVTSYMAEIQVHCTACGTRFRFLGLPGGFHLAGAAVSVDGYDAAIAITPGDDVIQ